MSDFDEISRRNWEQRRARRRGGTAEQPTAPPPTRRLPDDTARPPGSPPEWRRRPLASSPPAEEDPRRPRTAAAGNRMVRWFRDGGYLWVGAVLIVLVFAGAFLLLQSRLESGEARNPFAEEGAAPPPAAPGVVPTAPLPGDAQQPQPAAQPSSGGGFVVTGTAEQGLFLRDAPSTASNIITTLPEGTRVEQVGDDQQGDNLTWRNVRAPDGQEGWVAVDWLRPE